MKLEILNRPGSEWDTFAETHPAACLGHAGSWAAILQDSYGLKPHYLCARDSAGSIRGVLPLLAFRGRPGGRCRLISLPFLDAAGILATDAEAHDVLLTGAIARIRAQRFSGLELRTNTGQRPDREGPDAMDRVNLVLRLEAEPDAQWEKLGAKVRNQCRKAEREGLVLAGGDPATLLTAFYRVFQINMRDLGSPVHSIGFFRSMASEFGPRLRFVVTCRDDQPVGGLVAIRFGDRVHVPWASTLRSERNRCPNNQIYWEAIRWAIETGARAFDFGRSPIAGGTYRFKKGWGADEEGLSWRRFDETGQSVAQSASPESTLLRQLSQVWTRLPVPVASAVGSRIRRYFAN